MNFELIFLYLVWFLDVCVQVLPILPHLPSLKSLCGGNFRLTRVSEFFSTDFRQILNVSVGRSRNILTLITSAFSHSHTESNASAIKSEETGGL